MKKVVVIAAVLVLAGAAGAYWYLRQKQSGSTTYSGPVTEINVGLKWIHQAQFTGNYVAVEKGYYAEQGLKVNLLPYDSKNIPIDSVVKGTETFGIAGADEIVLARAKGIPVKAIAVIYKTNPVVAYTLPNSGITKPQDFIGKTVGIERVGNIDTNVGYLYYAMMARLGIDRSKIKEVTIGSDDLELLAGKTDVSTGYIINEPNLVKEKLGSVNTILMADYGVNMYADVLFASDETVKNQPDLCERFVKATLAGWQYAIENESEATDIVMKYATNTTREHQANMLSASIPLINIGGTRLGYMDPAEWARVESTLRGNKLLTKPVTVTDAYTNQFIQQLYPSGQ